MLEDGVAIELIQLWSPDESLDKLQPQTGRNASSRSNCDRKRAKARKNARSLARKVQQRLWRHKRAASRSIDTRNRSVGPVKQK